MSPGEAVLELTRLGFCFRLEGEGVRVRFEGEHPPDPAAVATLLDLVKAHKDEVRYFLKSFCPRCGCCLAPDYEGRPLCMSCDCTWKLVPKNSNPYFGLCLILC